MSLVGKVALVTGGARGIGRSFVENLLEHGAKVAICNSNVDVGEATAKELTKKYGNKVIFLPCDVTNHDQFEDCFESVKKTYSWIDIVINNAGIGVENDPVWKKMVEINFIAVVKGTQLGLKYMSKNEGGRGGIVVNIASITAFEPFPGIPVYSATKAAVNQLSRSYGHDLYYHKSGVKVISINPGMTKTDMTDGSKLHEVIPKDTLENFAAHYAKYPEQSVENLGKGLIEVLHKTQNGAIWMIDEDKPPRLVSLK